VEEDNTHGVQTIYHNRDHHLYYQSYPMPLL